MSHPESSDHLFNLEESAEYLGVSTQDVEALLEAGRLSAYRLGGVYLRFRKEQLDTVKRELAASAGHAPMASAPGGEQPLQDSLADRMVDFLYFNDFYLVSAAVIGALLWLTLKT